ncbi:ATP synthase subunit I [Thermodesulfobacteriota bacterium]
MEPIRETQKKYGSRAISIAIVIGFILILVGQKPLGKGLVLGALFSVINFVLMGETLPLKFGKSKRRTFFLSFFSIVIRYLLLAIPVILAVKLNQFNVISTVFGIFMIQFVILMETALKSIKDIRKKQI